MPAKIQKWGNSLGVRIPKALVEKAHLKENSEVEIEHHNGTLVLFPVKKQFSLKMLLELVTDDNLHGEEDFRSEGREVW